MEKKYILTNQTKTIVVDGKEIVLHRIQLVKSLLPKHLYPDGSIKFLPPDYELPKATFGGYVESEENLSQEGNCWIYGPSACVYGNARVLDNAMIRGLSQISGDAVVCGESDVGDHSILTTGTYKDVIVSRNNVSPRKSFRYYASSEIDPEISK